MSSSFQAVMTITAVDKVSAVIKSINNSIQQISRATKNLNSAMSEVGQASGKVMRDLRNISLVVIGAGASLLGLAQRTASASEEILIAAQNAGVGVVALQKLRFAASHFNIEAGELDDTLKFLNKSIGTALSDPASEAAAAFRSMGIELRDSNGNAKAANVVMEEMSAVYQKNADGAKKVATSMVTMGRGGSQMIAFLNQGPEAMRKQQEAALEYGYVMEKEVLEKNAEFEQQTKNLSFGISGLVSMIGTELIPVLMPVVKTMLEWLKINKQWLAGKIAEGVKMLANGLAEVWKGFVNVITWLAPVVRSLGGFRNILIAIVGAYLFKFVLGVAELASSVYSLTKAFVVLSAAILASPITWIVAALAALAYAIYWVATNWDKVKVAMQSVWEYAKPFMEGFLNIITLGMYSVVKVMIAGWNLVNEYTGGSLDSFYKIVTTAWSSMLNYLAQGFDWLLGLFGVNLESIKNSVSSFIDWVTQPFKELAKYLGGVLFKIVEIKNAVFGAGGNAPDINQNLNVIPNTASIGVPTGQALPTFGNTLVPQNLSESIAGIGGTLNHGQLDINMKIDYEGRPTKVTAKSPTNTPINFTASVGKMV